MTNQLRRWLTQATLKQARLLAEKAGTTLGNLRQIAGGYRTKGAASTTPETALALEVASREIPEVKPLNREDLCIACARCDYLQQIKGLKNEK